MTKIKRFKDYWDEISKKRKGTVLDQSEYLKWEATREYFDYLASILEKQGEEIERIKKQPESLWKGKPLSKLTAKEHKEMINYFTNLKKI